MAQTFHVTIGVTPYDVTDAIDETTIELTENAEEGSVAISSVTIDDPDLAWHIIPGLASFSVTESEATGDEQFYAGLTADRTYKRGRLPLGRQIVMQVADVNEVWQRRIVKGAECNRPAETDVARVQWLCSSEIPSMDTTYLSTASPVAMDAVDYRGQFFGQVVSDCSQASGKNWGAFSTPALGLAIWYGRDSLATYDSGVLLTNDYSLVNETDTFAIAKGDDTTLNRSPARVYTGIYLPYDGGAVWRRGDTSVFGYRDGVMPSLNVKSKTKAIARAIRYLNDLDEEDDRIETWFEVDAAYVNVLRPFQRVQFQASHLPGYELPVYCRVLKRTVSYATPGRYRIAVTLTPTGTGSVLSCATARSTAVTESVSQQAYVAPGLTSIAISPTEGLDCVIVAGMMASNGNVPTATDLTATGGYTLVYEANVSVGHPDVASIYKAIAAPSGSYNATASYTPGYSPSTQEFWAAVAASIRTSATTPVQSKGANGSGVVTVTLDSPPTPGNMLVMVVGCRASGALPTYSPETGWSTFETASTDYAPDNVHDTLALAVRCVEDGDGSVYGGGVAGGGTYAVVAVSEWEIT